MSRAAEPHEVFVVCYGYGRDAEIGDWYDPVFYSTYTEGLDAAREARGKLAPERAWHRVYNPARHVIHHWIVDNPEAATAQRRVNVWLEVLRSARLEVAE